MSNYVRVVPGTWRALAIVGGAAAIIAAGIEVDAWFTQHPCVRSEIRLCGGFPSCSVIGAHGACLIYEPAYPCEMCVERKP